MKINSWSINKNKKINMTAEEKLIALVKEIGKGSTANTYGDVTITLKYDDNSDSVVCCTSLNRNLDPAFETACYLHDDKNLKQSINYFLQELKKTKK